LDSQGRSGASEYALNILLENYGTLGKITFGMGRIINLKQTDKNKTKNLALKRVLIGG